VVDRTQSQPLHAVIRRGDARLVDYLLQAGADVNGVDGEGGAGAEQHNLTTPHPQRMLSVYMCALCPVLSCPVLSCVVPAARNQTPLAKACDSQRVDRGYLQMVEALLAHPEVHRGLETRDAGSNTALLNAIFRSNVWITRWD
jgi:hypothetical protein